MEQADQLLGRLNPPDDQANTALGDKMPFSLKMTVNRKSPWNLIVHILFLSTASVSPVRAVRAEAADAQLAAAGKRVFNRCAACHKLDSNGEQGLGPNLYGILGMKAGTQEGFNYSDALKRSGIVWTAATLDKWIANPKQFVPGSKMGFAGLPNAADRNAVIAYIKMKSAAE